MKIHAKFNSDASISSIISPHLPAVPRVFPCTPRPSLLFFCTPHFHLVIYSPVRISFFAIFGTIEADAKP